MDEYDELITRISPTTGEVEYGIPVSRRTATTIERVAEAKGMTFDEAANLLVQKGFEVYREKCPEQLRKQIDRFLKS